MLRIRHTDSPLALEILLSWVNVEKCWVEVNEAESRVELEWWKLLGNSVTCFLKEKLQPVSLAETGKTCRRSYSVSCKPSKMIKASILEELKVLYRKISSESGIKRTWLLNHNIGTILKSWYIKNLFFTCSLLFDSFLFIFNNYSSVPRRPNLYKLSLTWNSVT